MRTFKAALVIVALIIALGSCNNTAPVTAQDPATLVGQAVAKMADIKSCSFEKSITISSQDKSSVQTLSYSGALAEGNRVLFTQTGVTGRQTSLYQRDDTYVAAKEPEETMWNTSSDKIAGLQSQIDFLKTFEVLSAATAFSGQSLESADGLSCQKVSFEIGIEALAAVLGTTISADIAVDKPATGYVLISPADGFPRKLVMTWELKGLEEGVVTDYVLSLSKVNQAQSFPADADVFPELAAEEVAPADASTDAAATDASATDATDATATDATAPADAATTP